MPVIFYKMEIKFDIIEEITVKDLAGVKARATCQ